MGKDKWTADPIASAYIPVKEMLAHAPGFRALYAAREVAFEETYADIVDRAFLPFLRGPHDRPRKRLLRIVEQALDGKVVTKDETFFLRNKQGLLEFTLLAEGLRKLALIWILIQNGTLLNGSVLFWDEPETNLNPRLMGLLVEILVELQRLGVQILIATHDYVMLKEFDLRTNEDDDQILYHALFRDEDDNVQHRSTEDFLSLDPNAISDTLVDLHDRDVERDLEV